MPEDVAEDERGRLEPRNPAQRREIRLHREVAVATLPARDLVARDRVHLHVEREQVVAALDRMLVRHLVAEELRVKALSHEPALHVGERDDDRVDRAGLDLGLQLVERQHARDPMLAARLTCQRESARNTRLRPAGDPWEDT